MTPGFDFGVVNEMSGMARHGGADEKEAWRLEVAEREEEDPRCSVAVGGEENDLFGGGGG
jgi:hypothetical protein